MTHETNEFFSGRDDALGAELRAHFASPDDARFAARLRELATAAARETAWDVLTRWAVPGLAAAALLIIAVGTWLGAGPGAGTDQAATAGQATPADALVELAGDYTAPGGAVVLASFAE
jgi:hypothetical protein